MDVFVKVMEVTVDSFEDESGRRRQRHRVKLSMKYLDQETGRDLDPDNSQMEQDLFRSGGNNKADNTADKRGTGGADSNLGRALASNIGMSSAIDPGNLILKGKQQKGAVSNFNGYALVGEEEGEDSSSAHNAGGNAGLGDPPEERVVKPMGRGRGTTLPAWMTQSNGDDKLGSIKQSITEKERKTYESEDDSYRHIKRSSKHSKKEKRHKQHRRHKKHRRKESRHRDRSISSSRSRSRSRSRDRKRSRKHSRRFRRDDRYSHSRSRSRSRQNKHSRSRSVSRDRDDTLPKQSEFSSIEEARAIMERLERQRSGRRM